MSNGHFTKEDIQKVDKLLKCTQLHYSWGKCKLKPQWTILPEWLKLKWLIVPSVAKDVEQPKLSCILGECKLVQPLGETICQYWLKLNIRLHDAAISLRNSYDYMFGGKMIICFHQRHI